MGRMAVEDMMVWAGEDDADRVLQWHLFNNHFPPLPTGAFEVAKQVIAKANAGEFDAIIELPEEVGTHRRFGQQVPVRAYLAAWHLEPFVTWEVEEA